MRKLKNQWGDRNPQMSKPQSLSGWDWVLIWATVAIGSIVTVGMSWL